VAQHLAVLSQGSPLFDKTGLLPSAEKSSDSVLSYLSIQEGVSGKAKMYTQKYAQFVIDYAIEWEKVVTSRVSKGLKNAEQMRVELDHYQRKVESLRQTANATMAKGKQVDQKSAERLTRNEEKLVKVRETHNSFIASLCTLIDEVTDRSWRDLHPLMVKIAQFEVTVSGDEAKALSSLNTIVNEMKRLAVTHGIKPQARLKDLDSLDPSMLSTKAPGSGTLSIEAGTSGLSLTNDDIWSPTSGGGLSSPNANDQRLPPGSVAPQGMGGFPVSVQSNDNYSVDTRSHDGSITSGYGGSAAGVPSTLDMMAINASAAPPPTVDSLTAAFGPTPTNSRTAPNSGPPMGGRKQSYDSFDSAFSGFSGASAPPPAAPPPPPPPPPSQFGAAGAADTNPFGPGPPAPAPPYASNAFGGAPPAPSPHGYGAPNSYGTPNMYGGAPASTPTYGAPPPPYYGNAPSPYGQQQPQQQQQQPPNQGYGQYPQQQLQPLQQQQQQQYGNYQSPTNYGQQSHPNQGTNPFG
jgi:hypothetical protein